MINPFSRFTRLLFQAGRRNPTNRPYSDPEWSSAGYGPYGATAGQACDSRNRRASGRGAGGFLLIAALVCVCAMAVASLVQFAIVLPMERRFTEEEANKLAADLDAMIRARASAVSIAAGSLETENMTATGGLNRLLANLKDLFPDFLSLEIYDEQGRSLAMMGELALSRVGKNAKLEEASSDWARRERGKALFGADPAEGCFHITLAHKSPDGAAWFSRTRFSGDPLTTLLRSDRRGDHVQLAPTASGPLASGGFDRPAGNGPSGAHGLFTRSISASVDLAAPGWMVKLDRTFAPSLSYWMAMIIPGLLLAICAAVRLFSGPGAPRENSPSEPAAFQPAPPSWPASSPVEDRPLVVPEEEDIAGTELAAEQATEAYEETPDADAVHVAQEEDLSDPVCEEQISDEELSWLACEPALIGLMEPVVEDEALDGSLDTEEEIVAALPAEFLTDDAPCCEVIEAMRFDEIPDRLDELPDSFFEPMETWDEETLEEFAQSLDDADTEIVEGLPFEEDELDDMFPESLEVSWVEPAAPEPPAAGEKPKSQPDTITFIGLY